tara:strand:- start:365 stop:1330 length:966 start_codon:yes stop_codon:yes gene_type:complete
MKNISSLIFATFLISGINAQNCTDLFISEYVEGSYNNKAIELYNPTSDAIDLSNYALSRWSNGQTTPLNTILSGTIAANDAFVIALDKRNPNGEGYETPLWNGWYVYTDSITGLLDSVYTPEDDLMSRVDLFICPNYEDGTMYFNGNDAVTLETSTGDIIDIIGKIGEDPGEAWGDDNDAYWTKDQTLIRKASVTGGFVYDASQPYSFDPTLEWDSLPQNTFTELGQHSCNCSDNMSINEFESVVNLYPNPNSSGLLNIESTSPIKELNIFNLIGQNVFSKNCQGLMLKESIEIDPSLNGVYFMSVKLVNNKRSLKKLIIK